MSATTTSAANSSARRLPALYAGLVRAELQAAAAYRAQLVLWVIAWVVPLAFLALWRGAAANGPVGGITATQFSTYFCLLLVTTNLQVSLQVTFETGWLIHGGQMSARLLMPAHPAHQMVARAAAEKVYALPVLVLLVPVALLATGGAPVGSPAAWAVAVVVTALGTVALTYLSVMAGAIAFWWTKSQGLQGLLVGAEWVLGGIVAPVALLPEPWRDLVRHQPLYFADGAGPELLSGITTPSGWTVLEAGAWVVLLHLALARVWRRALLRFDAVGG